MAGADVPSSGAAWCDALDLTERCHSAKGRVPPGYLCKTIVFVYIYI